MNWSRGVPDGKGRVGKATDGLLGEREGVINCIKFKGTIALGGCTILLRPGDNQPFTTKWASKLGSCVYQSVCVCRRKLAGPS